MYGFIRTDGSVYGGGLIPQPSLIGSDPVGRAVASDPLNRIERGSSFMGDPNFSPADPTTGARVGDWLANNTTAGGLWRSAGAPNATPSEQYSSIAGLGMLGLGLFAANPIAAALLSATPMAIDYFNNNSPFAPDPGRPSDIWNDPDTLWDPNTSMPTAPTDPVTAETTYDNSGGSWGGGDGNSGNWSAGSDGDAGDSGGSSWA
jgi:hypothetical protein